jgi:Arc/MetJ-type ribon-helix-helix transcriptional regulator
VVRNTRPNQVSVSLAPEVKAELTGMLRRGEIFSIPEFIREAVEDRLVRWKREHPSAPTEG